MWIVRHDHLVDVFETLEIRSCPGHSDWLAAALRNGIVSDSDGVHFIKMRSRVQAVNVYSRVQAVVFSQL